MWDAQKPCCLSKLLSGAQCFRTVRLFRGVSSVLVHTSIQQSIPGRSDTVLSSLGRLAQRREARSETLRFHAHDLRRGQVQRPSDSTPLTKQDRPELRKYRKVSSLSRTKHRSGWHACMRPTSTTLQPIIKPHTKHPSLHGAELTCRKRREVVACEGVEAGRWCRAYSAAAVW